MVKTVHLTGKEQQTMPEKKKIRKKGRELVRRAKADVKKLKKLELQLEKITENLQDMMQHIHENPAPPPPASGRV